MWCFLLPFLALVHSTSPLSTTDHTSQHNRPLALHIDLLKFIGGGLEGLEILVCPQAVQGARGGLDGPNIVGVSLPRHQVHLPTLHVPVAWAVQLRMLT